MKNSILLGIGFILGIVATVVFSLIMIEKADDSNNEGLTIFDKAGDCISRKSVTIFQVLEPNLALAYEEDKYTIGLTMLLTNTENKVYYDEQHIKLPKNTCFRAIGTYRYRNKQGDYKTVPVVIID